jgi:hypothetical protein
MTVVVDWTTVIQFTKQHTTSMLWPLLVLVFNKRKGQCDTLAILLIRLLIYFLLLLTMVHSQLMLLSLVATGLL